MERYIFKFIHLFKPPYLAPCPHSVEAISWYKMMLVQHHFKMFPKPLTVSTLFKSSVSLKSQNNLLTVTTIKQKHKLCTSNIEWHRIYIPFQKGGNWHSEEILGLSKAKTQEGKHQILQLHVWYLDFGFNGPRWLCPSTFAAQNIHFSLGCFHPHTQHLWQMPHSSGIFNILASSLQPRLYRHSSMQCPLMVLRGL